MKDGPPPHGNEARNAIEAVMDDQAERELRRSLADSKPVDRRPLMLVILGSNAWTNGGNRFTWVLE
jgi:hypothetical protein